MADSNSAWMGLLPTLQPVDQNAFGEGVAAAATAAQAQQGYIAAQQARWELKRKQIAATIAPTLIDADGNLDPTRVRAAMAANPQNADLVTEQAGKLQAVQSTTQAQRASELANEHTQLDNILTAGQVNAKLAQLYAPQAGGVPVPAAQAVPPQWQSPTPFPATNGAPPTDWNNPVPAMGSPEATQQATQALNDKVGVAQDLPSTQQPFPAQGGAPAPAPAAQAWPAVSWETKSNPNAPLQSQSAPVPVPAGIGASAPTLHAAIPTDKGSQAALATALSQYGPVDDVQKRADELLNTKVAAIYATAQKDLLAGDVTAMQRASAEANALAKGGFVDGLVKEGLERKSGDLSRSGAAQSQSVTAYDQGKKVNVDTGNTDVAATTATKYHIPIENLGTDLPSRQKAAVHLNQEVASVASYQKLANDIAADVRKGGDAIIQTPQFSSKMASLQNQAAQAVQAPDVGSRVGAAVEAGTPNDLLTVLTSHPGDIQGVISAFRDLTRSMSASDQAATISGSGKLLFNRGIGAEIAGLRGKKDADDVYYRYINPPARAAKKDEVW